MNSQEYNEIARRVGVILNTFFEDFCSRYPEYQIIKKDYLRKEIHLNGVQFYAGFISGKNKDWEKYIEIPVIIEMIMIWTYKTNRILDKKQEVWKSEENIKSAALDHDLMLSLICDLFDRYQKRNGEFFNEIRKYVDLFIRDLAYGYWIEKNFLNVNFISVENIIKNWDKNYTQRNVRFNQLYDLASLLGYSLSSGNFEIIEKYQKEIDVHDRFSNVGQIINDLGDFGDDVDKHVKVYQDLFSDIRNGIMTFPIYKLIKDKIVLKALKNSKVTNSKLWQRSVRKLIIKSNLNVEVLRISEKAYDVHKYFFERHISTPSPLLMKAFGMLVNNKFFDQKIINEESKILRNRVVLCDIHGKELGNYDKLLAHKEGKLHKAFSIFIYNKNGELLMQKRADGKYHSGGLWANTCCSHYMSGEDPENTAHRRLVEEMGFDCNIKKRFSFVYDLDVGNGMREHEFDMVFEGKYDGDIKPNPLEAQEIKWISMSDLKKDITAYPEKYGQWFKKILERMGALK